MNYLDRYKVQITYPSFILCFDYPENLNIIESNLRYILNDMKIRHHNYCLVMFSKLRKNNIEVNYCKEQKKFQIGCGEYLDKKECLEEIIKIVADWVNDKEEK